MRRIGVDIAVLIASAALCFCPGCRHHVLPAHAPDITQPREPARVPNPRLTVITNNQAPIKYQWALTNNPDGAKVLKFTPNR